MTPSGSLNKYLGGEGEGEGRVLGKGIRNGVTDEGCGIVDGANWTNGFIRRRDEGYVEALVVLQSNGLKAERRHRDVLVNFADKCPMGEEDGGDQKVGMTFVAGIDVSKDCVGSDRTKGAGVEVEEDGVPGSLFRGEEVSDGFGMDETRGVVDVEEVGKMGRDGGQGNEDVAVVGITSSVETCVGENDGAIRFEDHAVAAAGPEDS